MLIDARVSRAYEFVLHDATLLALLIPYRLVPAPVAADGYLRGGYRLLAVIQRFRSPPITALCPAQLSSWAAASQRQQHLRRSSR
jgi:hypothetical protein